MIVEFQFTPDEWREAEEAQLQISRQTMGGSRLRSALFTLLIASTLLLIFLVVRTVPVANFPPHPGVIIILVCCLGVAILSIRLLRRSASRQPTSGPSGYMDVKPRESRTPASSPVVFLLPLVLALIILSFSDVRITPTSTAPTADSSPSPLLRNVAWKELVRSPMLYLVLIASLMMLGARVAHRRLRKTATTQHHRVDITPQRLIFDDGHKTWEIPADAIARYVETPRLMLIVSNDQPLQIIPKRAFAPTDLLEFRELLGAHMITRSVSDMDA